MKLIGLLLLLLSTIQAIEKPSWCSGAKLYVEKRICISPVLFKLEDKLLKTYRDTRDTMSSKQQKQLKREQRTWIKKRNKRCDGRADSCIEDYYKKRITLLANSKMPHSIKTKNIYSKKLLHTLKNMTYHIDGKPYFFNKGEYINRDESENFTFGRILASGGLTGKKNTEYAISIYFNSGGSGIFTIVSIVKEENGKLISVPGIVGLGDRTKIVSSVIKNKKLIIKVIEHGENDAMCCPSKRATHVYKLSKKGLRVVK